MGLPSIQKSTKYSMPLVSTLCDPLRVGMSLIEREASVCMNVLLVAVPSDGFNNLPQS